MPFVLDPEIESESTIFVIAIVPDNSLDSLWHLSKGRGRSEEPAISN